MQAAFKCLAPMPTIDRRPEKSMRPKSLCMIFEAIGPFSAIGKVAMSQVSVALEAGFSVTVVAKQLDESLRGRVEWRKLYCPPRGFAVQWLTARPFIKAALGNARLSTSFTDTSRRSPTCATSFNATFSPELPTSTLPGSPSLIAGPSGGLAATGGSIRRGFLLSAVESQDRDAI